MRILVALLIVLAVLYYWDTNYNRGALSDGVVQMGTIYVSQHRALETV
jgi:hypothetical protein